MQKYFRVIRSSTDRYTVLVDGEPVEMLSRKKNKQDKILVGDWVSYMVESEQAVIEAIQPRLNTLVRPHVSNIDGVVVVLAETPTPDFLSIDKMSYNCAYYDIDFIICINKIDIASKDFIKDIHDRYSNVAYAIVYTSAKNSDINNLYDNIKSKMYALAGQSAVGKSSIINALLEHSDLNNSRDTKTLSDKSIVDVSKTSEKISDAPQLTGDLSLKANRGRHTTTGSKLFSLDDETLIVDTPGYSMLDVDTDINYRELGLYAVDFDEYRGSCKFSTCTHTSEQVCGVKTSVGDGKISQERYQNYVIAFNELQIKQKNKY